MKQRPFSFKALSLLSTLALTLAFSLQGASPANANDIRIGEAPAIEVAAGSEVTAGAQNFVDSLAKRGIGFLSNESLTHAQRKSEFRDLLRTSFDMKTIARFALGRYWRTATDTQKKEYLQLFEEMIIEVYSKRFGDYKGEELSVDSVRPDGKSDALVTSYIIPSSGSKIRLDWRIRYKNGAYQVVDIIVEGVSMALTQRSDFASVIQRGGGNVDVLLAHLENGSANNQ